MTGAPSPQERGSGSEANRSRRYPPLPGQLKLPLLFLLLLTLPAHAQRLDSLQAAYPFLRTSANRIENASIGLQRFYQRLAGLPLHPAALPGGRVSVVHIGDSHLQADEFSGRTRRELQRTYGNAGLGLAFPFGVAHTNGSPAFHTVAVAGTWQARRALAAPDSTLSIGVSGFVLTTADSGAAFTLRVPALRRPNYSFNKLTVLRQAGPAAFDWVVSSAQGRRLGLVPGVGPGTAVVLRLDSLRDFVELRTTRTRSAQTSGVLYGLLLDNGQPGIIYNTIGVNGTAVRHFACAPLFFEQLPLLEPDLFIISLGTNDAYSAGFDPDLFARQLDSLINGLRRRCPRAEVLLAAPPDSYRARRYRNPDLERLRTVLRAYAQAHDLAYWDLAAVQGGYGSMRQWRAAGLAQADLVHFTHAGYDLQGLLLYLALQDGFAAFRAR
ncbi:GDSL-type esterase/lipase family protein [Hymenobacter psoromatis]|uniref:GDSL-type esterase/lipase family protein n=1 Tax=Hymenobacter psoromatis TaxID=1484116 RepID=UPI001CBFF12F|nr:GDSL-type esterase/lipase family protein [Hymenobacter psoromatis]